MVLFCTGKVDVVKQDMARVNTDILKISELKWTGTGKFNSDDCCIYYCSKESLRGNGVVLIVTRRVWSAVLVCDLKTTERSLFPRKTTQHHSNPSLLKPLVLKKLKLINSSRTNIKKKKKVLFIIGDWNVKVDGREISRITGKFDLGVQNEAGWRLRILPREHSGHSKHPFPTTPEMTLYMDINRWSMPKSGWLCSLQQNGKALYSQ